MSVNIGRLLKYLPSQALALVFKKEFWLKIEEDTVTIMPICSQCNRKLEWNEITKLLTGDKMIYEQGIKAIRVYIKQPSRCIYCGEPVQSPWPMTRTNPVSDDLINLFSITEAGEK